MRNFFLIISFALSASISFSQSPEVVVQTGHSSQIFVLNYSSGGDILLSASSDNTCNLWDVNTGMCFRSIAGNGDKITSAVLSRDGALLAIAASGDREVNVQVWETASGKLLHSFSHGAGESSRAKRLVDAMDFSPAGDLLGTKSENLITVWNLQNGSEKIKIEVKKTAVNTAKNYTNSVVKFLEDGKFIAAEESPSGLLTPNITVWNLETGKPDRVIEVTGKSMSGETKKAVGSLLNKIQNPSLSLPSSKPANVEVNPFHWYMFSPDGTRIAYIDGGTEKLTLSIWSSNGGAMGSIELGGAMGKIIDQIMTKSSGGENTRFSFPVAFSHDNNFVAVGIATQVKIYDAGSLQPVKTFSYAISAKNIFDKSDSQEKLLSLKFEGYSALAFHPKGTMLSGGGGSLSEGENKVLQVITAWNIQTGREVIRYEGYSGKTDQVCFTTDGEGLISLGTSSQFWNLSTGNINALKKAKNGIWQRQHGGITDTVSISANDLMQNSAGFEFKPVVQSTDAAWELKGGKSAQLTDLNSKMVVKKLETNGSLYIPGFRDNKPIVAQISDGTMKLMDVTAGTLLQTFSVPTDFPLEEAGKNFHFAFDSKGKYLTVSRTRFADDIWIWNTASGQMIGRLKGHCKNITSVSFSPDGRLLATASGDAEVLIWELPSCKQLASLVAVDSIDFIITTPDNYYLATKGALEKVAFRMGTRAFPFEQFDLRFNRPDIVLTRLGTSSPQLITAYHKAYLKRLKKMGFAESDFNDDYRVPVIHIGTEIPVNTSSRQLSFNVTATDESGKLNRLNVWVNDVPVYGMRGKDLRVNNSGTWSGEVQIELSAGINKIQVSCLNERGAESLKETHVLKYEGVVNKPELYLLTIGISQYKDARFNLQFAAKDAKDISSVLGNHKDLYANVYTKQLLDAQVTAADVAAAKSFFANAKVDDVVIIFIAGHGLLDAELNYYFATFNVDFSSPASAGLAYDAIEAMLDGIKPRKKMLFMDTCHSGEVDKDEVEVASANTVETGEVTFRSAGAGLRKKTVGLENSFELMQALFADLRRGTGATILSSAGGAEFAMEGAQWNNGVFTYCLLTGLRDLKADLDGDKKIMLSELEQYVRKQVSELTGGRQAPTSRMENLSGDVRIW